MIHANQLIVRRGGIRALDEVSTSVIGGEMVAIVGPSGAGKSTLLKTLSGDMKPSQGDAWLGGRKISDWSRRQLALRRAVLPQVLQHDTSLTAFEVVLLGRAPHAAVCYDKTDREICEAALAWVHANHLRARLYPTLSVGEQRRVQWARVLAQIWGQAQRGDAYIFLDEPLGGLDLLQQHQTLAVAKQLAGEGVAVVIVLNDLNLVSRYCDRVILMQCGRVVDDGAPAKVFTSSAMSRAFGLEIAVVAQPGTDCLMVSAA